MQRDSALAHAAIVTRGIPRNISFANKPTETPGPVESLRKYINAKQTVSFTGYKVSKKSRITPEVQLIMGTEVASTGLAEQEYSSGGNIYRLLQLLVRDNQQKNNLEVIPLKDDLVVTYGLTHSPKIPSASSESKNPVSKKEQIDAYFDKQNKKVKLEMFDSNIKELHKTQIVNIPQSLNGSYGNLQQYISVQGRGQTFKDLKPLVTVTESADKITRNSVNALVKKEYDAKIHAVLNAGAGLQEVSGIFITDPASETIIRDTLSHHPDAHRFFNFCKVTKQVTLKENCSQINNIIVDRASSKYLAFNNESNASIYFSIMCAQV